MDIVNLWLGVLGILSVVAVGGIIMLIVGVVKTNNDYIRKGIILGSLPVIFIGLSLIIGLGICFIALN
ncbi:MULTISPECIES: hypothetical protein [unclassified Moraxella]|uniref:hypothetical protein n=1 Tax=unclassified Moraxella TaxID=2685852 RepID=UPI003AF725A6